jgi:hypothetical protein
MNSRSGVTPMVFLTRRFYGEGHVKQNCVANGTRVCGSITQASYMCGPSCGSR